MNNVWRKLYPMKDSDEIFLQVLDPLPSSVRVSTFPTGKIAVSLVNLGSETIQNYYKTETRILQISFSNIDAHRGIGRGKVWKIVKKNAINMKKGPLQMFWQPHVPLKRIWPKPQGHPLPPWISNYCTSMFSKF